MEKRKKELETMTKREKEREGLLENMTSEVETSKKQLEERNRQLEERDRQLEERNRQLEEREREHLTGECERRDVYPKCLAT